jgi:hypothetical protein
MDFHLDSTKKKLLEMDLPPLVMPKHAFQLLQIHFLPAFASKKEPISELSQLIAPMDISDPLPSVINTADLDTDTFLEYAGLIVLLDMLTTDLLALNIFSVGSSNHPTFLIP